RPPRGRLARERGGVEELPARVDLELDEVGSHALVRLVQARHFPVQVARPHVNRRSGQGGGPDSNRGYPEATCRRALASCRLRAAWPKRRLRSARTPGVPC